MNIRSPGPPFDEAVSSRIASTREDRGLGALNVATQADDGRWRGNIRAEERATGSWKERRATTGALRMHLMLAIAPDAVIHQSSDSRDRLHDRCLWQSYNTGRDDMNKKLNQVTQAVRVPKSTWFVLGSLLMIGLYLYHALFSRN